MINLNKLLGVTANLFLIFVIGTDLLAATSQSTIIELNKSSIASSSAVINPDTSYSPAAGDKRFDY